MTKLDKEKHHAYKLGHCLACRKKMFGSDERVSYTESAYRRQREALQRARKQTRELKREVTELNALVVKLASKL
tara:strand:- start:449 stop:670 length:222 start_codon:yes stop_codon:yes gene_type:complete